MDAPEIIVGLDIGTTKIACLVGRKTDHGKIEILGIGKAPSLGVTRGVVSNIEKTVQSIRAAVEEAESKSGIEIKVVNVGIAGQHIKSLQHRGMITRDSIEDEVVINGINFRFIDTAGIRSTDDEIETIGIRKTFENINKSNIVLYVIDSSKVNDKNLNIYRSNIDKIISDYSNKNILLLANKIDLANISFINDNFSDYDLITIGAKDNINIDKVKAKISSYIELGIVNNSSSVVTNSRHFSVLNNALTEVQNVYNGMKDGISSDLLAVDVRQALYHFGELTGEITNDELLGNIFSKFCIGK